VRERIGVLLEAYVVRVAAGSGERGGLWRSGDGVVHAAMHVVALVGGDEHEPGRVRAAEVSGQVGVGLDVRDQVGVAADVGEQRERVVLERVQRVGAGRPEVGQRI
jgi:hypothetical protein